MLQIGWDASLRKLVAIVSLGLVFLVLAAPAAMRPASAESPRIAAASDLQFALEDVADAFFEATGDRVTLVFGSSGNFARQIAQGAPFEMFLSADEAFIAQLHAAGHTLDRGHLYAIGRLVMIVPKGSSITADARMSDVQDALDDGRLHRFAIANPDHAPYGMRAREALQHAGLSETIAPFLVYGENVTQAAQFALSGNADGGLVAYSLALAPTIAERADHALIPEDWHSPLNQRMALMPGAGDTAGAFYDFVRSAEGRSILEAYGFVSPDAVQHPDAGLGDDAD